MINYIWIKLYILRLCFEQGRNFISVLSLLQKTPPLLPFSLELPLYKGIEAREVLRKHLP